VTGPRTLDSNEIEETIMGWIIGGIGVVALAAVVIVLRLLMLILNELKDERGNTGDDPVDWSDELTNEKFGSRAASAGRR
jgi:hypothetical protein